MRIVKAANVLVDDKLHCVISDFGQSEMKTEAFNISGAMPPRQYTACIHVFGFADQHDVDGTLRWQAPELMRGSSHLTKEMDVYSFAICCVEVLNWGNIPWAHTDDLVIRHLTLGKIAFHHTSLILSLMLFIR
jgi:abelson tyrosine-protein kinase 1